MSQSVGRTPAPSSVALPFWSVPALAFAVYNNIVPDFPLINKSFNLAYSGCDL